MTDASVAVQPPASQESARLQGLLNSNLPVFVGLLLLVIILWLPFGLSVPFWADGWPKIAALDTGVIAEEGRPLVNVPYEFARLLSPNLFASVNLLLIATIFGKASLFYLILKRLTGNKLLAFAAAALVIVFPVDTAIFNDGVMSIHFALFCYMGAVYALLAYWERPRWYWLVLMWLGLLFTTGIYETVYPLVLFTPLILLYKQPRISRRFVGVALFWYAVPLLVAVRLLFLIARQDDSFGYQSNLFTGIDPPAMINSLLRAYARNFHSGWVQDLGESYLAYSIAAGVITLVGILWFSRTAIVLPRKRLIILAVAGFVILGLGYAPYVFTALRDSTDRTYFYSSVGAAITIVSALLLLTSFVSSHHLGSLIFALLLAFIVGQGTAISLVRHQTNYNNGVLQLPVLRDVASQLPAVSSNTLVLVIDETPDQPLRRVFTQASFYFRAALQVLYENPDLQAALCYPHDEVGWGHFAEKCLVEPDGVTLLSTRDGTNTFPYDQIVVFSYNEAGTLTLLDDLVPYVPDAVNYDPNRLIIDDAPPTARISSMLGELGENSP